METQIKVEWSRERLSAFMDGQAPDGDMAGVFGEGNQMEDSRECWQMYHLIGDVLRAPDLARYGRDTALAGRVSAAIAADLASQPVAPAVLAPLPHVEQDRGYAERLAANDGVFRWKMVAGLASFAAVAAVGWGIVSGAGPQMGAGPQLAQSQSPSTQVQSQVLAVASPLQAGASANDGDGSDAPVMLRDARLDELLAAHHQAAGMSGLGGASGFLRNATFEGHGR